jgi:DNA-binding MarR family transcriptional regulator
MQEKLIELVNQINSEFRELVGGTFIRLDTGELFTKAEVDKYITRKLEIFSSKQLNEIKDISQDLLGVKPEQHLYNKRSKKEKIKTKIKFDNGDFNIAYKNIDILMELINMKLEVNEKLVYYVLRDFISYPSNSILINGEVPTMTDLEPLIGLKERTIRKALKTLEEKGLIKLKNAGVRKCIFFNPFYYASGKELDIATLKMFELLECNEDKVEEYIKRNDM